MYMSNVICSFWEEMSKELSEFCMQNLIELLSNQGLIYFSNGDDMERMMTQFKDKLQPEETLTQISREYERKFGFKYCAESAKKPLWIPSVYRKVTN